MLLPSGLGFYTSWPTFFIEPYLLDSWISGKGDSKHNANSFKEETEMKNSLDDIDNEEVKFEDVKTEGSDEVESFEMVF